MALSDKSFGVIAGSAVALITAALSHCATIHETDEKYRTAREAAHVADTASYKTLRASTAELRAMVDDLQMRLAITEDRAGWAVRELKAGDQGMQQQETQTDPTPQPAQFSPLPATLEQAVEAAR